MPFNELIKNINRVRDYIREFFVFGWRSRSEYDEKSPRSYDNEKKRLALWFQSNLKEIKTNDGRSVFSISFAKDGYFDRNPLYEIWKTMMMEQFDMSFHFIILDRLSRDEMSAREITSRVYDSMVNLEKIQAKLKEYRKNGILTARKSGRELLYSAYPLSWKDIRKLIDDKFTDAVNFFTEASPLGVIGSYIQDTAGFKNSLFRFSDDFIASTLDDKILFDLLEAIGRRIPVTVCTNKKVGDDWVIDEEKTLPLKILESVESGRRYAAMRRGDDLIFRNLEVIHNVTPDDKSPDLEPSVFYKYRRELEIYLSKCWDVDFERAVNINSLKPPEHVKVKFAIKADEDMQVLRRLICECRSGIVLPETPGVFVYRNALWNAREIIPFIMSFAGHVLSFECGNRDVEHEFRGRLEKMYANYGGDVN